VSSTAVLDKRVSADSNSLFLRFISQRTGFVFCLQALLLPVFYLIGLTAPLLDRLALNISPAFGMADGVPMSTVRYLVCLTFVSVFLIGRNFYLDFKATPQQSFNTRTALFEVVFHIALLYIVLTRCLQFELLGDDAFIDYKYARAWLDGVWDFNPGERVMGFTSHFHIMVLALVSFIFARVPIEQLSLILNCLLQCGAFVAIVALLRQLVGNPLLAAVGGAIFALSVFEIIGSGIGKEQPLGVLLMVLALLAMQQKRFSCFAWLSLAIALIRPEGIFWYAIGALYTLRLGGIKTWRVWILPSVCFALYHLILFAYFGSPFPHAAIVKSLTYIKRKVFWATFVELIRHIGLSFVGGIKFVDIYSLLPGILYLVPAGLVVLKLALDAGRKYVVLQFYTVVVLVIICFYSIPNSWIFNWYLLWFTLLPVLLPVLVFAWMMQRHKLHRKLLACVVLFGTLLAQITIYPQSPGSLGPQAGTGSVRLPLPIYLYHPEWARFYVYRLAALKVRSLSASQDVIAVTEPGLVAYFYGGPVLDLGGLISDKVVVCYKDWHDLSKDLLYAPPPAAISMFKPRFIIFHDGLVTDAFLQSPYFKEHYQLVEFWPLPIYGGTGTFLYMQK